MSDIARPDLIKPLLVFVGSGAGGLLRYGVDALVAGRSATALPWGILFINVTGSFAIGFLGGMIVREDLRALVLIGLLGGYTTFSAFSRDTVLLAQQGRWGMSVTCAALSVLLSVGACWIGMAMSHAARR
jgi:CrcB protein